LIGETRPFFAGRATMFDMHQVVISLPSWWNRPSLTALSSSSSGTAKFCGVWMNSTAVDVLPHHRLHHLHGVERVEDRLASG
jgi:hypothetical protein